MNFVKPLAVVALSVASMANAASYRIDISTTGYQVAYPRLPQIHPEVLTGHFIVDATPSPYPSDATGWAATAVTSFELTIRGRTFTLADIGWDVGGGGQLELYGLESDYALYPHADDFHLVLPAFDNGLLADSFGTMSYTTSTTATWFNSTGLTVTISALPVPEASAVAMAGVGLAMAAFAARRRKA